jgi:hypothetical protein
MTSDAILRGMRVLTLPSVLFATGLAGHTAGDGATPAGWVLVALFGLTVVAVAPFVGAAPSPARVMALLVGGQGVLHAALQLFGGTAASATLTTCCEGTGGSVWSPSSSHLMMHTDAAASHGVVMSPMSGGHLVMLLAHLAAAVVVWMWLAAGERALWMVLALAARPLVDVWVTIVAAARGVDAIVVGSPRLQTGWGLRGVIHGWMWTAGVISLRGPPGAA